MSRFYFPDTVEHEGARLTNLVMVYERSLNNIFNPIHSTESGWFVQAEYDELFTGRTIITDDIQLVYPNQRACFGNYRILVNPKVHKRHVIGPHEYVVNNLYDALRHADDVSLPGYIVVGSPEFLSQAALYSYYVLETEIHMSVENIKTRYCWNGSKRLVHERAVQANVFNNGIIGETINAFQRVYRIR